MSLYESFFIVQHVSNVMTFILRSWRLYVGVLLCFGVYWYNTPVHTETEQYTYIQTPSPEDECNNIRNMLNNKKLS